MCALICLFGDGAVALIVNHHNNDIAHRADTKQIYTAAPLYALQQVRKLYLKSILAFLSCWFFLPCSSKH